MAENTEAPRARCKMIIGNSRGMLSNLVVEYINCASANDSSVPFRLVPLRFDLRKRIAG